MPISRSADPSALLWGPLGAAEELAEKDSMLRTLYHSPLLISYFVVLWVRNPAGIRYTQRTLCIFLQLEPRVVDLNTVSSALALAPKTT